MTLPAIVRHATRMPCQFFQWNLCRSRCSSHTNYVRGYWRYGEMVWTNLKRLMSSNISSWVTSGYFFCSRMACMLWEMVVGRRKGMGLCVDGGNAYKYCSPPEVIAFPCCGIRRRHSRRCAGADSPSLRSHYCGKLTHYCHPSSSPWGCSILRNTIHQLETHQLINCIAYDGYMRCRQSCRIRP